TRTAGRAGLGGVFGSTADDRRRGQAQAHRQLEAREVRNLRPGWNRLAAAAGYVAYYGTYEIDASNGIVRHHVEGSTNTSWVGTTLVRYYDFSPHANRLTLSLKNAEARVTSTLTWERLTGPGAR